MGEDPSSPAFSDPAKNKGEMQQDWLEGQDKQRESDEPRDDHLQNL